MVKRNAEGVKRSYHAPRREAQAEATRAAILDAAHELFLRNGYAGTSVRAVADAADVSEQTIYNVFGDKPSLLFEVGKRIVVGELDAPSKPDRGLAEQLQAEGDPIARIRIVAAWSRMVWEQGMLQFESMLLDAAASAPRVAEVAASAWQEKYENNRRLFPLAFPEDTLPGHLGLDDALDIFFALDSAAFVRILIEDRGWSWDRYEHWLAIILQRLFTDIPERPTSAEES